MATESAAGATDTTGNTIDNTESSTTAQGTSIAAETTIDIRSISIASADSKIGIISYM